MDTPERPPAEGEAAAEASEPTRTARQREGEAWGRYELVELLGSGGMGRVHKAWDPTLDRHVALKILTGDDPELTERFVREARAQAQVEHPGICKVYEVGKVEGRPYIAMQLVSGAPLSQAGADLTVKQKVQAISQVADAVHAAHRAGLIHRDLKPANIMLETDEEGALRPVVVDFGLVRELGAATLTTHGSTLGTPSFMAPEQAVGDLHRIDRRTDVYSLGATLYTLLSGKPPFGDTMPLEALRRVISEDPVALRRVAPAVPADLSTIVMKCLAKEQERRYDSAHALAADLRRYLDGEPIAARPDSLAYRLARKARKNRPLVAVAAVAVIAVGILAGLWWHARASAARQAELAQRFGQRVEQVEGTLWRARSLPLHDMRPVEGLAATRLSEIADEMERVGRLASGPGHSALGRGFLALGDHTRAREHFEAAWNTGYRSPEVAYGLGLVIGDEYRRELLRLSDISDAARREARRRELEETLRDPALAYLRASSGYDAGAAEYAEALLAFHEGRYPQALELAQQAFERVPWLYEAKVLQADIHTAEASDAQSSGRFDDAHAALRTAEEALHDAAGIGESDRVVRERLCQLASSALHIEVWQQARRNPATYDRAIATCQDVLIVDPDSVAGRFGLVDAATSWAEYALNHGEDPTATLDAATAAAREAIELQPDNAGIHVLMGLALWQRGKHLFQVGQDPGQAFDEASQHVERSLQLRPRDTQALASLGLLALDRGVWEGYADRDPVPSYEKAAATFATITEILPGDPVAYLNLGIAYEATLEHLVRSGTGDPEATAAKAVAAFEKSLEINPNLYWTYAFLGAVQASLGELLADRGEDPTDELTAALVSLNRAIELGPNDPRAHRTLCQVHAVRASWEISQGRRADAALRAGREVLARLRALTGDDSDTRYRAQVFDEIERDARRPGL